MTLLHYYVTIHTTKADTDFKVTVSYPLSTSAGATVTSSELTVDGSEVLQAAMKIYIASGALPIDAVFGFYSMRMTPFFNSKGANQIDVVANTKRAVTCWFWGSPNGQGFNYKDTNEMSL